MPRARVLIDTKREAGLAGPDVIEVANETDYYRSRLVLRDWVQSAPPPTVWVTSAALAARYDDLEGDERVEVVTYSIRARLCELLRANAVPDVISDDAIRECRLLDLAGSCPMQSGESVEGWCLRAVMGGVWEEEAPLPECVADVLQALADHPHGAELLRRAVVWRLHQWTTHNAHAALWRWLADAPFTRAKCLLLCWAAQGYGEVGTQLVQQAGCTPEDIAGAVELLPTLPSQFRVYEGVALARLGGQLRHELSARLSCEGPPAIRRSRAATRDELSAALDYLHQQAKVGAPLKMADADEIRTWASGRGDTDLAREVALAARLLAEAEVPSPLPPTATWPEVCAWLGEDNGYFAAYVSRAVTGRLEETQEQVRAFEQWLVHNYQSLVSDRRAGPNWFAGTAAHLQPETATILILLDGVPAPLVRLLCDRLTRQGPLNSTAESLHCALLPTLTPINRQCLLSGRLPDQSEEAGLADLCRQLGADPHRGRAVDAVDACTTAAQGDLLFLHYRAIDDLLHRPMAALDRWLRADAAVGGMERDVRAFVEAASARGVPVQMGFISDHGWTELPKSAVSVALAQGMSTQAKHRRVLEGLADRKYGLPLLSHEYFLPKDMTIATGYSYLDRRPHGAVHGGATPQEAVVFGFWATTLPVASLDDLVIMVIGPVRRAVRNNAVTVRLANPNPEPVLIHGAALRGLQLCHSGYPLRIQPRGSLELAGLCDASGATGAVSVAGSLNWSTLSGRARRQLVEVPVATTGAAETDRAFEDMFET